MKQRWGLVSVPTGPFFVMVLLRLDLVVFLDYSHWRFIPLLPQPFCGRQD